MTHTLNYTAGKPSRVDIDDGFVHQSIPYDEEKHGWLKDQLDYDNFEAIGIGRQTEALVNAVNRLKRENFELKQQVKMWQKASGMFGE